MSLFTHHPKTRPAVTLSAMVPRRVHLHINFIVRSTVKVTTNSAQGFWQRPANKQILIGENWTWLRSPKVVSVTPTLAPLITRSSRFSFYPKQPALLNFEICADINLFILVNA